MRLSANLKDGYATRSISLDVPTIQNPFLPIPYVDSRWARPYVFHNVSIYPLAEANDVPNDFSRLVSLVNTSSSSTPIDRYKDGLLKIVDEHIARCGRLLFCDLLMYVDCLAYLCYASDLMTEEQIQQNYASWAKYIVDKRKNSIQCSTGWGAVNFNGSENERDLNSCF
ncbi:MAG: hypothetical protein J6B18_02345 [Bacteroidaceae bacterium]|nr:hypothetical protein [Bacteroidaceae bacterium]